VVAFLASMPNHKTVILDRVPTVENLAHAAFTILEPIFAEAFHGRLRLASIRLYETPNCWADISQV
jgi:6-pyruvoyltetrahydropterin/6-carboxytetrahydropterin synthase